ncbi:MAG: methyltransferase family protein [Candidatus Thorarchaeota archaeon]
MQNIGYQYAISLFLLMFVIWIVTTILLKKGSQKGERTRKDRASLLILYVCIIWSLAIAYALGEAEITMLPEWFYYLGIIIMIIGFMVREWALIVLGKYFSTAASVAEGQKLIDKGPYQYIMHPAYAGIIITMIGLSIAFQTIAGVIILIIINGIGFGYRIKIEEEFLKQEFGEEYLNYMKKKKRIIPLLL